MVCLWCGRNVGRAVGRSVYGHVITKCSRIGRLPHFLSYGAPPRRAWSSAMNCCHSIFEIVSSIVFVQQQKYPCSLFLLTLKSVNETEERQNHPLHVETQVENCKRYVFWLVFFSRRKVCSHETFFVIYILRNTHRKAMS